jgi:MFS family permease
MTSPGRTGGIPSATVTLAATLAIQIFTSLAATAAAVLAPAIAPTFDLAPKWIGVFVGLVYAGAMTASLASGGFIDRYGAIRVSQACVLLCATGVALIAVAPAGAYALLVLAPILIGVGYGPITPASSQLLVRTSRPERMALVFSIKQTGVPVGVALAGASLPGPSIAFGWRGVLIATALLGVGVALVAQPIRASLDNDRNPRAALSMRAVAGPLRTVFDSARLRTLALLSFAYAATQVCLTSFLVVFLTDTLGWSLVTAGAALTAATVGGVVGRIGWGAIADRAFGPTRVLVTIGAIAAACGMTAAAAQSGWPRASLFALWALFGMTAMGWNGVQLAQVARHAPAGSAGSVTGAAGFITFAGVVVGPPAFALLAGLTGGYRIGFVVFALVSLASAVLFARNQRRVATPPD